MKEPSEVEHEYRVDATMLTLPILSIISLLLFVAWGTWMVSRERYMIDQKFNTTNTLIAQLVQATDDLTDMVAYLTTSGWSRADMMNWCRDLKQLNPQLNCPTMDNQGQAPILQSTQPPRNIKMRLDRLKKKATEAAETHDAAK